MKATGSLLPGRGRGSLPLPLARLQFHSAADGDAVSETRGRVRAAVSVDPTLPSVHVGFGWYTARGLPAAQAARTRPRAAP